MNPAKIAENGTHYLDYGAMGLHALILIFIVAPLLWWTVKSMKSAMERNITDLRHDLEEANQRREQSLQLYHEVRGSVDRLSDIMVENTREVRALREIFDQRIKPKQ